MTNDEHLIGKMYEATEDQQFKLATLRAIVADHQAAQIEGVLVDVTTANVIVKIHDALSPKNQASYLAYPITRMANIAWKLAYKGT